MKKGMWWWLLSLLWVLGLSGCAVTTGGQMEEALKSGRAVIISPVLTEGGTLWARQGNTSQRFSLIDVVEAHNRVGSVYQMVTVEPGTYHLFAASGYAGPGRAVPGSLATTSTIGTVGELRMFNRMYRESYVERVWKDSVVERVVVPGLSYCVTAGRYGDCQQWGQNPPTVSDRVVQRAGWYEERRFRPAVSVVDRLLEFGARAPLATLEVRAGDAVLINAIRVPVRDVGYDAQRCAAEKDETAVACPLDLVVVELGPINMGAFREQAAAGPASLDPALVARVKPYPVEPRGQRVRRSADALTLYEFRGATAVAPRLTSPPAPPAR